VLRERRQGAQAGDLRRRGRRGGGSAARSAHARAREAGRRLAPALRPPAAAPCRAMRRRPRSGQHPAGVAPARQLACAAIVKPMNASMARRPFFSSLTLSSLRSPGMKGAKMPPG
jgi:hypothetical protein